MAGYSGRATVVDGDRQEAVDVSLEGTEVRAEMQTQDGVETTSSVQREWGGRVTSPLDETWCGKAVMLRLPDGRIGGVTIEASGDLHGSGDAPFDF
jgi:hypothetical protein